MSKLTEQELAALFDEYAKTKDVSVRNRLLENYLYIAEIIAKKFSGRGVDFDDLYQVASLSLVNAIERFDASRGIKFQSFATPTLIGEIKNYFRDKTRMLHISRRDSEQLMKLSEAKRELADKPDVTPKELAEYVGVDEERILELLEMQQSVSVSSLNATVAGDDDEREVGDVIGDPDDGYISIDNSDFLKWSLGRLDKNERRIIYERFWKKRSQKQVAELMGVSQMQISRSEKKILKKLADLARED